MDLKILQSYIHQTVRIEAPAIDPITQELLAQDLAKFVVDVARKFNKGFLEHGGRLVDRDLHDESRQEIMDLFVYNAAAKWNPTLIPPAKK